MPLVDICDVQPACGVEDGQQQVEVLLEQRLQLRWLLQMAGSCPQFQCQPCPVSQQKPVNCALPSGHCACTGSKRWLSPDSYRQLTSSAFSKLIDTRRGPATSYDASIRRKPCRKPRPEMLKSIWFVASFRSASMLCVKFPSEMRLRRPSLVRRLPCSTCQHASDRLDNQKDSATYLWRHSCLSSSDQRLYRQHACEHEMQQGLRQP